MSELLKLRVEGSPAAVQALYEFLKNLTSVSSLHTRTLRDSNSIFGDFSVALPPDPIPDAPAADSPVITVDVRVVRDEPRGLPAPRRVIGP